MPQFIDSDEWGIRYDINHQQRDGLSPLHISVTSGQVDMVKYFLSRGADFNLQDKQGFSSVRSFSSFFTALMFVCFWSRKGKLITFF